MTRIFLRIWNVKIFWNRCKYFVRCFNMWQSVIKYVREICQERFWKLLKSKIKNMFTQCYVLMIKCTNTTRYWVVTIRIPIIISRKTYHGKLGNDNNYLLCNNQMRIFTYFLALKARKYYEWWNSYLNDIQ